MKESLEKNEGKKNNKRIKINLKLTDGSLNFHNFLQ